MSRAFPQLLPPDESRTGYQSAKCMRCGPDDVERYDLGGMRFGKWTGAWECRGGSAAVERAEEMVAVRAAGLTRRAGPECDQGTRGNP